MDNRKTVHPAAGRRVRKPDGALLALDGESVIWSSYWLRRHRDGDVTIATDADQVAEVQPAEPPTKPVKGKEPA